MTAEDKQKKCVAKGGGYLDKACWALRDAVQMQPNKRSKGVFSRRIINIKTHQTVGTMVTLHSGDYVGSGVLMNYCPFCGERLHDREPPQ